MSDAEATIGCGQAEELILQAKDELSLLHEYARISRLSPVMCRMESLGDSQVQIGVIFHRINHTMNHLLSTTSYESL